MNTEAIVSLIHKEGWELKKTEEGTKIIAYGHSFPFTHPVRIYLKLYSIETNPDSKYLYMKAAHDYLWPNTLWHYWTERRFREHCAGWNFITYAGCAESAKSHDAGKIGALFWLANPKERGVIVASTTLESLESRIWGYVKEFLNTMAIKLPFQYISGNTPKVLFPAKRSQNEIRDTIHGMFAVSAKGGSDSDTIKSWIGRHPKEALMIILDECTDLPVAILGAFANLDPVSRPFQCLGIGNSNSWHDVHGALSTPAAGRESVDPRKDIKWETTQRNGICLYFGAYESPAIYETDPERKKKLGIFLPTEERIKIKENTLGKDSDDFWRFVLGFWKDSAGSDIIISDTFLNQFNVKKASEWLGLHPLHIVGGLDPAFSAGGDKCILRLAILGVNTQGQVVLDFRDQELIFDVPINRLSKDAAEIQVAQHVVRILNTYNCPLHHICIDATGQGRAIGGVIYLHAKALKPPIKIYSTRHGIHQKNAFDVVIKNTYELWSAFRDFTQHGQIKGLDNETLLQLSSRRVELKNGKLVVETKSEYKKRMGAIMPSMAHSPDRADAAALVLQSAIINFGFHPGQKIEVQTDNNIVNQKMMAWNHERMAHEIRDHQKNLRVRMDFSGTLVGLKLPAKQTIQ